MGVGILLFQDLSDTPVNRLLTFDKAGYGYLLTQGQLCGESTCYPGSSGGSPGFAYEDPGNSFPFAGNLAQCTNQEPPMQCDRITSMAFSPDSDLLYVWPSFEKLTSFTLTDNSPVGGAGLIGSNGTTICGSGTGFTSEVVPGDTITDTQTGSPDYGQSAVVTQVTGTQLTISQAFSSNLGSCSSTCGGCSYTDSYSYNGYFINPVYDVKPNDSGENNKVNYPGGAIVVTSNGGSGPVVWALASVGTAQAGTLFSYDAGTLKLIWCSNTLNSYCDGSSAFAASLFALPTVVNGYAYVPNSGITQVPSTSHAASTCNSSSGCSGVIVYSGH
jgi:hypothetical protein